MMLVSFMDLTAQKEAQSALMRAEKEKQANEAKSKFLANMRYFLNWYYSFCQELNMFIVMRSELQ
jgi:hypothetical protein